jgi:hypothetical protein
MRPDFAAIAKRLYDRRGEAVLGSPWMTGAPPRMIAIEMLTRWVLNNPEDKAVRGWMFFDFSPRQRVW